MQQTLRRACFGLFLALVDALFAPSLKGALLKRQVLDRWPSLLVKHHYCEALSKLEEALACFANNLSYVYSAQGFAYQAVAKYRQALVIMREVGVHDRKTNFLNKTGLRSDRAGLYTTEALKHWRATNRLWRSGAGRA